jgi:hypothetical protein
VFQAENCEFFVTVWGIAVHWGIKTPCVLIPEAGRKPRGLLMLVLPTHVEVNHCVPVFKHALVGTPFFFTSFLALPPKMYGLVKKKSQHLLFLSRKGRLPKGSRLFSSRQSPTPELLATVVAETADIATLCLLSKVVGATCLAASAAADLGKRAALLAWFQG